MARVRPSLPAGAGQDWDSFHSSIGIQDFEKIRQDGYIYVEKIRLPLAPPEETLYEPLD